MHLPRLVATLVAGSGELGVLRVDHGGAGGLEREEVARPTGGAAPAWLQARRRLATQQRGADIRCSPLDVALDAPAEEIKALVMWVIRGLLLRQA